MISSPNLPRYARLQRQRPFSEGEGGQVRLKSQALRQGQLDSADSQSADDKVGERLSLTSTPADRVLGEGIMIGLLNAMFSWHYQMS